MVWAIWFVTLLIMWYIGKTVGYRDAHRDVYQTAYDSGYETGYKVALEKHKEQVIKV